VNLIEAAPEPPKAERMYPVRTVVISGATDPAVNGTWLLVNGVPVERLDDVTADLHTVSRGTVGIPRS
jgi:hypothetical protein